MHAFAAMGLVVAALAATASGDAPVTPVGSLKASAIGITLGPDGALWHTSTRAVGSTTTDGVTKETDLAIDANARAITTGPDGALWFVHHKHAIGRIAPGGDVTVFDDLEAEPNGLTAGPDGNLWYAAKDVRRGEPKPAVGRMTPAGELTIFSDGFKARPRDIAAGPDGALWFTEPDGGRVGRITTDGVVSEFVTGGTPTSIAAGPDGALWATDATGSITRVATDGAVTHYAEAGTNPGDIAAGPDGALWYTLDAGFARVTTAGSIYTWSVPNSEPVSIAAGPDDGMYFTDANAATLQRIDISAAALAIAADQPSASPTPSVSPSPQGSPTPERARTIVVAPAKGAVRVRIPGRRFKRLDTELGIPVGSIVDTRRGAVALRSQTRSGEQRGTFRGGLFRVRQARTGHTALDLRGRLDCGNATAQTARRRHKRRRIWGKDSGGDFSTHGRDSVTTVRGTKWLTLDTCHGTITRVRRGSVVVRDRATGDRHVVTAGHSHLARHVP